MKSYSLLELRKQLLQAIAGLPTNSTTKVVENTLDPFVLQWNMEKKRGRTWDVEDSEDDKITPYLVACDRNQISCLYYIEKAIKSNDDAQLWGLPQFQTSEKGSLNMPMHHAALSGCTKAIDVSHTLTMNWYRKSTTPRSKEDEAKDLFTNFKFLLESVNSYGDNPLMMACATGHIGCVRYWTTCILKAARNKRNKFKTEIERIMDLKAPFKAKNNAEDSALSLAAGHGHYEVVDFLVNDQRLFSQEEGVALVKVTIEEIDKCKSTIDLIDAMLKKGGEKNGGSEACKIRENVRRCLVMMQVALARKDNFKNTSPLENGTDKQPNTPQHLKPNRSKKNRKKIKSKLSKSKKVQGAYEGADASIEKNAESTEKINQGDWDAEHVERLTPGNDQIVSRIPKDQEESKALRESKPFVSENSASSIEVDKQMDDDGAAESGTKNKLINSPSFEGTSKRSEEKLSNIKGDQRMPKRKEEDNFEEDEDLTKIIHSSVGSKSSKANPAKKSSTKKHALPQTVSPSETTRPQDKGKNLGAWNRHLTSSVQGAALPYNLPVEIINHVKSPFVTLEDGTLVNAEEWKGGDLTESGRNELPMQDTSLGENKVKSVEEMLRERYREGPGGAWATNDHSIDAVMDSLCLDASMLLLSPHGMAMQLSPAQLEAVTEILYKQIDAVEEAREIQSRLRKLNKSS